MICKHEPCAPHGLTAPPAYLRRQPAYRIHFRDGDTNHWRLYANFQFLGEAEACLHQLLCRGIDARLDTSGSWQSSA